MNLLDFARIGANVIIFLILWQIVKIQLLQRNPDSEVARAMAFVTAG